jgi:serine/threonine protein kinase
MVFAPLLEQLSRAAGGAVFHSYASQLKSLLTTKVIRSEGLIELLEEGRHGSGHGTAPAAARVGGAAGAAVARAEHSLSDFQMIRALSSGGIGQVWLARKRRTGDYFAVKAMRKGRIRELRMSASVHVESAILVKHTCPFLVRGYYAFRSVQHIYFALEFLPGGDLTVMLRNCGCVPEDMARCATAHTVHALSTASVPSFSLWREHCVRVWYCRRASTLPK